MMVLEILSCQVWLPQSQTVFLSRALAQGLERRSKGACSWKEGLRKAPRCSTATQESQTSMER